MELFWKVVSNVRRRNGGELQQNKKWKWEDEVRRIWKKYLEVLYNIDTQEQVSVHICGFDGIQRGSYFGGEPIGRAEIEADGEAL